jgi:hypothetical protein
LDACVVGHRGAVFGHFAEGASSVSVVGRHVVCMFVSGSGIGYR